MNCQGIMSMKSGSRFMKELNFKSKDKDYGIRICVMKLSDDVNLHIADLSVSEKNKFEKLNHIRRKVSYVLGKLVAKYVVSEEGDDLKSISIEHGFFNQPFIRKIENKISITHCDNIGAALSFDPTLMVGIDIEKKNEKRTNVLNKTLCLGEMELFEKSNDDSMFFLTALWTLKEAMSKTITTGFTASIDIFEVDEIHNHGEYFTSGFKKFKQFQGITFDIETYVFSIVVPKALVIDFDIKELKRSVKNIIVTECV